MSYEWSYFRVGYNDRYQISLLVDTILPIKYQSAISDLLVTVLQFKLLTLMTLVGSFMQGSVWFTQYIPLERVQSHSLALTSLISLQDLAGRSCVAPMCGINLWQ